MAFTAEKAELHLGILNMKLNRMMDKMRSHAQKMEMKDKDGNPMFDVETEKLHFEQCNKDSKDLEAQISEFENKVLDLTEL